MTVVPNARIAGVTLTGVHRYKAVAAMGKTLELDGGDRVLCKQRGGDTHKSDEPHFHTFPHNMAFPMGLIMDSDRAKLQVAAAVGAVLGIVTYYVVGSGWIGILLCNLIGTVHGPVTCYVVGGGWIAILLFALIGAVLVGGACALVVLRLRSVIPTRGR